MSGTRKPGIYEYRPTCRAAKRLAPRTLGLCSCGAFFYTRVKGPARTTCTGCRPLLKRAADKRFRELHPEANRARQARRRARLVGSKETNVSVSEIQEKAGLDCYVCSLPINPELKHPDPQSQSIEHIVPLSRGGSHVLDNLALSHLVCNMRKGAK